MPNSVSGRPREFDLEAAVDKAMYVFWARGYEGASVAELTDAMGISKPSLYAAFGDKRGLFTKVMERYAAGPRSFGLKALALPTAREAVEAVLLGVVEVSTRPDGPKGCLQTQGALACGVESEEVKTTLAELRLAGEARMRKRLRQAQRDGDLPATENVAALSTFVATFANGITVQGASGVPRKDLEAAVKVVMRAWPVA